MRVDDLWFRPLSPLVSSHGSGAVVILPAAGAGAHAYRALRCAESPAPVLVAVPPGREHRWREPAPTDHEVVVAEVGEAIGRLDAGPCTLFGHSAGAIVALDVARRAPHLVRHLVVGGAVPPDERSRRLSQASDEVLADALRRWGGTPDEVTSDRDALATFLPALRADLERTERAARPWSTNQRVDVPLTATAALDDRSAQVREVRRWVRWTTADFAFATFTGGHFFPVRDERFLDWLVQLHSDRGRAV